MMDTQEPTPAPPFGTTPYGSPRVSAYYAILGPSPDCEPDDRDTARAYWMKIEAALAQGGWTENEVIRLRKLRKRWARRAMGRDPRFKLVGTRNGRLHSDLEYQIGHPTGRSRRDSPHPFFVDKEERKQGKYQKRTTEEQEKALRLIDADLPHRKARGANVEGEQEYIDPESGPVDLPTISAARQYLIPGQDTKGHAHRVYCRIMPAHYRAMCAVERERAFGFRTVGDVMRWCIDFGVRELAARAKSPQTRSALAQVDVMRQILLDEQYYMDYEQVFELMTTTVNRHLSAGAEQEAVRLITTVRHEIEAMTETYWREKYMKELMSRYGSYIDGSRIKAMDFGGDE
jgi:hypothetical protein